MLRYKCNKAPGYYLFLFSIFTKKQIKKSAFSNGQVTGKYRFDFERMSLPSESSV